MDVNASENKYIVGSERSAVDNSEKNAFNATYVEIEMLYKFTLGLKNIF